MLWELVFLACTVFHKQRDNADWRHPILAQITFNRYSLQCLNTIPSSSSSLSFNGGLYPRALHYRYLLDYSSAMLLQFVFRSHFLFTKPVLIKKLQIFFLPWLITPFCSIYFIPAPANPSLNSSIIILLCSSYLLQCKSTCSMVSNVWQSSQKTVCFPIMCNVLFKLQRPILSLVITISSLLVPPQLLNASSLFWMAYRCLPLASLSHLRCHSLPFASFPNNILPFRFWHFYIYFNILFFS